MLNRKAMNIKNFLFASAAALATSMFVAVGCSGSGGGSLLGDAAGPNISGKVSSTSGSSALGYGKPSLKSTANGGVKTFSAGCIVTAYDITSGEAAGAAATSDANGNYSITGLTAGTSYRVVADCGGSKFASVASATNLDPSTLTDDQRVKTNPRTTVIAAMVMKAVLAAVADAVSGLPPAAAAQVKQAVVKAMDSAIAAIEASINEAVESGAMAEPNSATATTLATTVASATEASAVETAISSNVTDVPAAVDNAATGASAATKAIAACDSTKGGTIKKCTQVFAQMAYGIGFGLVIRLDGQGAFDNGSGGAISCASSASIGNSQTLGDRFPNANFIAAGAQGVPAGYCGIVPKIVAVNRNRDINSEGGGQEGRPEFAETGNMDGAAGDETGILTAIASGLFNGKKYRLSDLDGFIFGTNATKGGLNARLINVRRNHNGGGSAARSFYVWNGSAWSNSAWLNTCQASGFSVGSGSAPCRINALNFDLTPPNWTVGGGATPGLSDLANVLQSNTNVIHAPLSKKFSGTIPTQAELEGFLNSGKNHRPYNPSGEPEFYVVTTNAPNHGAAGANPCGDNNAATPCTDASGAAMDPVRVDLTFGSPVSGFRPITNITKATSGAYYLRPYWSNGKFSGVFGFVKAADGRIAADEFFRERAVKLVLDNATECNANGIPSSGCSNGKFFNVKTEWSCESGPCSISYSALSTTAIVSNYLPAIQTNFQFVGQQYCAAGNCQFRVVVGKGQWPNVEPIKLTLSSATESGKDTFVSAGTGRASAPSEYNVFADFSCTATGCTFNNRFSLIGSTGAVYNDAGYGSAGGSEYSYSVADINSIDLDPGTGGTQSLSTVAGMSYINNGPVRSSAFLCQAEPFFVDGNGNGRLDCTTEVVNGIPYSIPASGDKAFNGEWQYDQWLNDPSVSASVRTARAAMSLRENQNTYSISNPVGALKLLSVAFNGWFDGLHSLGSTTDLDALQAFALIYLFFEEEGERGIEGLGPTGNDQMFEMITPAWLSGAPQSTAGMNTMFAKLWTHWAQD